MAMFSDKKKDDTKGSDKGDKNAPSPAMEPAREAQQAAATQGSDQTKAATDRDPYAAADPGPAGVDVGAATKAHPSADPYDRTLAPAAPPSARGVPLDMLKAAGAPDGGAPRLKLGRVLVIANELFEELNLYPYRRPGDPPIINATSDDGPFVFQLGQVSHSFHGDVSEDELRQQIRETVAPLLSARERAGTGA